MRSALSFLVLTLMWPNQSSAQQPAAPAPIKVAFCELIRNPGQYESKEIEVRGTYRYAFEISELYCFECFGQGRTWIRFSDDVKVPDALHRYGGTFNVTFIGTFRGNGHFGHLGLPTELEVHDVQQVKKVYKLGVAPDALPPDKRKKVCGAQPARQ